MFVKKISIASVALFFSFAINFSAFGDDLEIYLGARSNQVTYKPNVLFIMDTSGSMSGKDGTALSRMQRVQTALNQALSGATNINAGLMRFSDFGGPILYPVTDIDKVLPPEILLNTKNSGDDAYEISNSVTTNTDELVLTSGTATVTNGLRFTELDIPRGATITQAVLRFTSANLNTAQSSFLIKAEDVGDATAFSSSSKNITNRSTTSQEKVWDTNNEFPLDDETVLSADFSNVVQEVVDRSDWCGGNAINIILQGTSTNGSSARRAYASDKGDSRAPQLVVSYDDTNASGCVRGSKTFQVSSQNNNLEEDLNGDNNTLNQLNFSNDNNTFIGVRFENLNIPQAATISKAHIVFTAAEKRGNAQSRMTIKAVAKDDTAEFNNDNRQLASAPKTSASVTWSNIGQWQKNTEYQSPDVKDILQEIVNRSGWVNGNGVSFTFENFSNKDVAAYTYRGNASRAPKLIVEYEGNATPGASATVRDYLKSRVNELSTSGYTPIVDTLYEASLYFGGMSVDYGLTRGQASVDINVRRSTRVSHRDSYTGNDAVRPSGCSEIDLSSNKCVDEYIPTGATYISPVTDLQCQTNNHIVLLSDGQANNNHSVSKIEALLGKSCTGNGGEKCGLDLVENINDSNTSKINARITTHTIGFSTNQQAADFLRNLALKGSGGFYEASDSSNLLNAFNTILSEVKKVNTTFVSPGVAVNQLNRLSHRDELYFALFRPEEGTLWPGNLKKYKIKNDIILDKNASVAVDSSTGFFQTNAQSYWSTVVDGNDVSKGGAAGKLDLVRSLYTFDDTPGNIFKSANEFNESNTSIDVLDLAISQLSNAATVREEVLKWARGVDLKDANGDGSTSDVNYMMGDPIHSQPVIVNYSATENAVFVATNHGFLHSFNAETGEENFAIIPRELLSNLYDFYQDRSSFNHIYGLDGDIVYREANGKKYLYVGMRRGGNNYYVIDITSQTNPKLVFTIKGGQGDYANLGQTWSRPIITKVDIGGTVKDVMIIGGGYDENQDAKKTRSADSVGNSVYMIDADTGALLWSASKTGANLNLADMQYSIPARISVIDRNNDGLADHMYVADMGGQVFRLDIYNGNGASTLVKGGLLANLAGNAEADARRFYYGPDVSEIILGDEQYYAVALGSGFRAGPLNTVIDDNFYMIKDKGVFQRNSNNEFTLPSTAFVESDLYNATDHLLTSSNQGIKDLAAQEFANKEGWYLNLTTRGEKVLSAPLILDYKVLFTTYIPASSSTSLCAPPSGNSRAYLVNLFNGNSLTDLNINGERDKDDRYAELAQTGIAPDSRIVFGETDVTQPALCLGAECASASIEIDANGNEVACGSRFECLTENLFGRFERVRKDTWKTEVERN